MENNALEILGGRFSILYDGVIVMQNVVPEVIECQPIPPYNHLVYAFTARSNPHSLMNFDGLVQNGAVSHTMCKISNGFAECDAYIDSYEIEQNHASIEYGGHSYLPPGGQQVIIQGHVEARSINDDYKYNPNRVKKKKPEPIYSRFDILDL